MGEESSGQRRGCSKRRIHLPCILPSVSSHADFTFLVDVVHFYTVVEIVIKWESHSGYCIFSTQKTKSITRLLMESYSKAQHPSL